MTHIFRKPDSLTEFLNMELFLQDYQMQCTVQHSLYLLYWPITKSCQGNTNKGDNITEALLIKMNTILHML